MDDLLKKRLIGAIVLVALGVIFIPALMDGSGYKARQARSIEIPPKPEIPSTSQTRLEPVPTPVDKERELREQQQNKKPARQKPDKETVDALALQVSTLTSEKSALALRDKLRKKGYTAYISNHRMDSGEISYRVRIGPELDRKRVDALHDRVKKEEGLDGFVVNHP